MPGLHFSLDELKAHYAHLGVGKEAQTEGLAEWRWCGRRPVVGQEPLAGLHRALVLMWPRLGAEGTALDGVHPQCVCRGVAKMDSSVTGEPTPSNLIFVDVSSCRPRREDRGGDRPRTTSFSNPKKFSDVCRWRMIPLLVVISKAVITVRVPCRTDSWVQLLGLWMRKGPLWLRSVQRLHAGFSCTQRTGPGRAREDSGISPRRRAVWPQRQDRLKLKLSIRCSGRRKPVGWACTGGGRQTHLAVSVCGHRTLRF
jgi:hypothetical protein